MNTNEGPWAAGIGCRRDCPATAIGAVLDEALAVCGLARGDLHCIASIDTKKDEAGLTALAEELGIVLSLWPAATLRQFEPRLLTPSTRVHAATGVAGIAEAAALAAITSGNAEDGGARLTVARRGNALATVAIACRSRDGMA